MTEVDNHQGPVGARASAKPKPVTPVNRSRLGLASAALAALAVAVVAVVDQLADSTGEQLIAFALGLAIVPLIASPIEWFVHRFVYHEEVVRPLGAIFIVHTAHHYSFFPTWRYVTNGPARRLAIRRRRPDIHATAVANARVRLAHFTWYMTIGAIVIWLPTWFATRNAAFLAGVVISSAVVSNLFIVVHDTIHRPGSHRIVEAQRWFAFLDRHHYIHHVDLGANLNFLLPLADMMFGTLRRQLTPEEVTAHGSLMTAKSRPIGEGERARLAMVTLRDHRGIGN